jgi:hypothetical protein
MRWSTMGPILRMWRPEGSGARATSATRQRTGTYGQRRTTATCATCFVRCRARSHDAIVRREFRSKIAPGRPSPTDVLIRPVNRKAFDDNLHGAFILFWNQAHRRRDHEKGDHVISKRHRRKTGSYAPASLRWGWLTVPMSAGLGNDRRRCRRGNARASGAGGSQPTPLRVDNELA